MVKRTSKGQAWFEECKPAKHFTADCFPSLGELLVTARFSSETQAPKPGKGRCLLAPFTLTKEEPQVQPVERNCSEPEKNLSQGLVEGPQVGIKAVLPVSHNIIQAAYDPWMPRTLGGLQVGIQQKACLAVGKEAPQAVVSIALVEMAFLNRLKGLPGTERVGLILHVRVRVGLGLIKCWFRIEGRFWACLDRVKVGFRAV